MSLLASVYRKSDDLIARQIGDELLLVPISQAAGDLDSIYTLNDVAAFIWELLDGSRSLERIRRLVAETYEVSEEEAEEDLTEFIRELISIRALEPS